MKKYEKMMQESNELARENAELKDRLEALETREKKREIKKKEEDINNQASSLAKASIAQKLLEKKGIKIAIGGVAAFFGLYFVPEFISSWYAWAPALASFAAKGAIVYGVADTGIELAKDGAEVMKKGASIKLGQMQQLLLEDKPEEDLDD
jgi:hypothetical protein